MKYLSCLLVLPVFALLHAPAAPRAEPNLRIVFNDDAQVLMEAPEQGASQFVRDWLDHELRATPMTTFVFLAATPDVTTFDSKVTLRIYAIDQFYA